MNGTPCETVGRLTLPFIYTPEIELRLSEAVLIVFRFLGLVFHIGFVLLYSVSPLLIIY